MDEAKLHDLMGKVVSDMGGAWMMAVVLVVLGAQAGEPRLREVFAEAGFSRFRRATETPFNLILEARK